MADIYPYGKRWTITVGFFMILITIDLFVSLAFGIAIYSVFTSSSQHNEYSKYMSPNFYGYEVSIIIQTIFGIISVIKPKESFVHITGLAAIPILICSYLFKEEHRFTMSFFWLNLSFQFAFIGLTEEIVRMIKRANLIGHFRL